MLHPSYTDLMTIVNKDIEEGETKIVNSRYSIVLATSKRARQIINGSKPLVRAKAGEKPLSIAIDELYHEELKIIAENSGEDFEIEYYINNFVDGESTEQATEGATKEADGEMVEKAIEVAEDFEDIDVDNEIVYIDEE